MVQIHTSRQNTDKINPIKYFKYNTVIITTRYVHDIYAESYITKIDFRMYLKAKNFIHQLEDLRNDVHLSKLMKNKRQKTVKRFMEVNVICKHYMEILRYKNSQGSFKRLAIPMIFITGQSKFNKVKEFKMEWYIERKILRAI